MVLQATRDPRRLDLDGGSICYYIWFDNDDNTSMLQEICTAHVGRVGFRFFECGWRMRMRSSLDTILLQNCSLKTIFRRHIVMETSRGFFTDFQGFLCRYE